MRYPTEGDLRMSLQQTPPAYMALMPSFPSFILHFPFSLSLLLPLKSYHGVAEASHFSRIPLFAPAYLFSVSLSVHLPPPSFLSLHPFFFFIPLSPRFPCFLDPPSYQTSEPTINAISFG